MNKTSTAYYGAILMTLLTISGCGAVRHAPQSTTVPSIANIVQKSASPRHVTKNENSTRSRSENRSAVDNNTLITPTKSGSGKKLPHKQKTKDKLEDNTPTSSTASSASTSTSHSTKKIGFVNWKEPTGGPYPNLSKYKDVWVDVSLSKQRTYIKSGNRTIYTMIVSTGLNTPNRRTPTGTYHIQAQRGLWFYAPRFQEGAKYWVSFLNHGEYLFHSVPMNRDKQVIVPVAEKLGHPASHGCVHLSLADAKWFYDHIKTGTKVVIQR